MTNPEPPVAGTAPVEGAAGDETTYCVNHPTVATALRCNRCGRYICPRCAVRTPVGYRCKDCVRSQQEVFFTAGARDYLMVLLVSVPLGLAAGFGANLLAGVGWFALWFLLPGSPAAGVVVADLAHRAAGRRRGRYMWIIVAGAVLLGGLPFLAWKLLIGDIFGVGLLGLYVFLATTAALSRMRFGRRR
jgi:hypothetical protein